MRTVNVTCVTAGCHNGGHTIPLTVDDEVSLFLCGVCGATLDPVDAA